MAGLIGVWCAAVAVAPAAAGTRDDARDAHRRTAQAEAILENATVAARRAALRLDSVTAALPAAQQRVATSRGTLVAAQVAAATAQRKADAGRAAYDASAAEFQQAQDRLDQARDRVRQIAAATYMGASFGALNMLVDANGPADAIDRLGLVDQVMQKQQAGVDELTLARRDARAAQDAAGLARRAAEDAEQDAAGKLATARTAQQSAVQAQADLLMLATNRRQALAAANAQRTAVLAQYQQARAEEARIEAALRAAQRRDGPPGRFDGFLIMPVHGWKSSDFGERYDPYYRVWQLHAGTDFAADGGTPIRAAAAGRVVQAGWNGGYGNYTCLSHGLYRGAWFSTCYGHQSAIGVHVGEHVAQGEVIGRVGTTGASTGYHLHFETRFNGVPRNPLGYLPSCLC